MFPILNKKTAVLFIALTIFLAAIFGFGGAYMAICLFLQPAVADEANYLPASCAIPLTAGDADHRSPVAAYQEMLTIPEIYALNADSVVEITTETVQSAGFFGQYIASGAGSAVVIKADGYLVTNNHVIENAHSITVRLKNGESYPANLVGKDKKTDLAVLKIEAAGLRPVFFGDSSTLTVGEVAVTIGNPLGELGGTLTEGIISALDRDIFVEGQSMQLLQTSAAVNPGNSGGGLFNSRGELVGIINAKSGGMNVEGLGFAIPVNLVAEIVEEIIDHGYVTGRPILGVKLVDISDVRTAMLYGVSSTGVYVFEATEDNGLLSGDRLVSIAGREIKSSADVRAVIDDFAVGDTVIVRAGRSDNIVDLPVTLVEGGP